MAVCTENLKAMSSHFIDVMVHGAPAQNEIMTRSFLLSFKPREREKAEESTAMSLRRACQERFVLIPSYLRSDAA